MEEKNFALPNSQVLFERLFEATPDANLLVDKNGKIVLVNHQTEVMFGYARDDLLGKEIEYLIPNKFHTVHQTHRLNYQSAPRMRPMGAELDLYAQRKNGAQFPVDITLSPIDQDENVLILCVVRDLSIIKARQSALQSQSRLTKVSHEIASAANQATNQKEILPFALNQIMRFLGWSLARTLIKTEEGELIDTGIWTDPLPDDLLPFKAELQQTVYEPGKGLAGLANQLRKPIWWISPAERPNSVHGDLFKQYQIQTALGIPIVVDHQTVAVLEFYNRTRVEADAEILNTLPEIAMQLGQVIERTRLQDDLNTMKHLLMSGVEAERQNLARQLHDGPLQDLYGAFYQLSEVQAVIGDSKPDELPEAIHTIQQVSQTIRFICGQLRPSTLIHLGLQKAILAYVERLQQQNPQIIFHAQVWKDEQSLNPALRLDVYRIFQYLINNVMQHAEAKNIWVRLSKEENLLRLELEDDGKGFQIPSNWLEVARQGHFGLVEVAERVDSMQGKWKINSREGEGTQAWVEVPYKQS